MTFLVKIDDDDEMQLQCDQLADGRDFSGYAAAFAEYGKTKGYDFTADEAFWIFNGAVSDAERDAASRGAGGTYTGRIGIATIPYRPPVDPAFGGHFQAK